MRFSLVQSLFLIFTFQTVLAATPIPVIPPDQVTGTKRVLVIRINFPDQLSDPQSKASLQTEMQSMKQLFRETTFNLMDINYEITENVLTMPKLALRGSNAACYPTTSMPACSYTLNTFLCQPPNSPTSQGCKNYAASQPDCMDQIIEACAYYPALGEFAQGEGGTIAGYYAGTKAIGRHAYLAAAAAGSQYNPDNFDYVYFRYNSPAPIITLSNLDTNKKIWVQHSDFRTFAHELAHAVGFGAHANAWLSNDGTPFGPGRSSEYGDIFDLMGWGGGHRSHFNAYNKVRGGWIPQNRVSEVEFTANASASSRIITISAHDTGPHANAPYAIRLIHPYLDTEQIDYWISFRQRISTSFSQNGVEIHKGYRQGYQSSIIDTNPSAYSGNYLTDISDAPLAIGRTITIPNTNISITPLHKNGTIPETVDVRIDYLNPNQYEIINWGGVVNDKPLVGHFYNDIVQDAVIYREGAQSQFWIKQSNGAGIMSVGWGQTGDQPQVGKFFTGSKSQVAVFRPSSGVWYILDPVSGFSIQQNWGQQNDISLVGNFLDERNVNVTDDKFEIAVFRKSNGMIYIRNPRTGLTKIVGWGETDDQPLVGDFLGRGYDQIAQYRSSNNMWYIRDMRNDEQFAIQFGSTQDIPVVGHFLSGPCTQIGTYRSATQTFSVKDVTGSCGGRLRSIIVGGAGDIPLGINISGGVGTFQRPALYRPSTGQWNIFKAFE